MNINTNKEKGITSFFSLFFTLLLATSFVLFSQMFVDNNAYAGVALAWPVPGHNQLSQGLHDHNAIDISDSTIGGATIIAAYGGTVKNVYKCTQQHYGTFADCDGFGTGIVILGDDGRTYQYAHMQANSIPSNIYVGAYVSTGQTIGKVGTTGYSSGNHLHFGICYGNFWEGEGNPLAESYTYSNKQVNSKVQKVVLKRHEHSYSSWKVDKAATCVTDGLKKRICSCGAYETKRIPAKGHSYGAWEMRIEPTCETAGEEVRVCEYCGFEETNEIETLEHDYQHYENEVKAGYAGCSYDKCVRCQKIINYNEIETLAQNKLGDEKRVQAVDDIQETDSIETFSESDSTQILDNESSHKSTDSKSQNATTEKKGLFNRLMECLKKEVESLKFFFTMLFL